MTRKGSDHDSKEAHINANPPKHAHQASNHQTFVAKALCILATPNATTWGFVAHSRTRQARLHIVPRISTVGFRLHRIPSLGFGGFSATNKNRASPEASLRQAAGRRRSLGPHWGFDFGN